jgi:uncharacterized protein YjbI with pentapeptide repeats
VFNGTHLHQADLDKANLTVAFLEHADLSQAINSAHQYL